MKIPLINGYTKETMKRLIRKYNMDKRSVHKGSCLYQSPDGNRCAVGCFIPDHHPALKSISGVDGMLKEYPDMGDCMPLPIMWLEMFQELHDMYDPNHKRFKGKGLLDVLCDWIDENVEDAA